MPDLLLKGGWMMYAILAASLPAVTIIIERLLYFARIRNDDVTLIGRVEDALAEGEGKGSARPKAITGPPVWAVVLTACSAVFAQEGPGGAGPAVPIAGGGYDETTEAEEIVVTGAPQRPEVEVVSGQDLSAESQAKTVEGRLENLAGVDLNRRSPAGSENRRLTLRGFDESRSGILLDGRSLHGAGVYGGYYVDWASLSLEDVEAVEVIRGVVSAKYGNTLGGVVNVVTEEPTGAPAFGFRTAFGSLGTRDIQADHSAGTDLWLYGLAFGHHETDGYLRNSFADRETLSASTDFLFPNNYRLELSSRMTWNEAGMIAYNMSDAYNYDPNSPDSLGTELGGPGLAWRDDATGPLYWGEGSYWKDRRLQTDLSVSRKTENADFSFQAYLMDQYREEFFYANDDPDLLVLQRNSEAEKNNWGWKMDSGNILRGECTHTFEYGAQGRYLGYGGVDVVSYDPTYFSPMRPPSDSPGKSTVTTWHGLYAQDTWRAHDNLEIQFGLRLDDYIADGPEAGAPYIHETPVSPRLTCSMGTWEGGRVSVRFARACRFPTNPEYYWWYSGYDPAADGIERKNLTSEKANQVELEISHEVEGGFSIVFRGYQYEVNDYIRTIFGYRPSRVVYNIDRVDLSGVEVETSYAFSNEFRVWANYTYQDTGKYGDILDHSTSDELLELPENKFNIGLEYGGENSLQARLKMRYVSERWAVRGDLTTPGGSSYYRMPAFVDVDLQAQYPVWRGEAGQKATLTLAVENMLDREIVEEYGYPQPGITFMAGVKLRF